jgi:hypothetical protein
MHRLCQFQALGRTSYYGSSTCTIVNSKEMASRRILYKNTPKIDEMAPAIVLSSVDLSFSWRKKTAHISVLLIWMIWAQLEWKRTKKSAPLDSQSVGGRSSWCCSSTYSIWNKTAMLLFRLLPKRFLALSSSAAGITCKRLIYATTVFWLILLMLVVIR